MQGQMTRLVFVRQATWADIRERFRVTRANRVCRPLPDPPTPAPLVEGPYAPGCLRVAGREVSGIGPLQWNLLRALWDGDGRAARDVAATVYQGQRIVKSLRKLSGLVRDLNHTLGRNAVPLLVESTGRGRLRKLKLLRTPQS